MPLHYGPLDAVWDPLLLFAPPPTRLCRRTSQVSVLRQHRGGTDSFLFPVNVAEIKPWDRQLFSLLVVQLETTRSRGTWFRFNVFLQLTRTICSSNFGYLFENKRPASVLPRQSNKFSWLQDRFRKFCPTMACGSVFSFIFATLWRNGRWTPWKKNFKMPIKGVAN